MTKTFDSINFRHIFDPITSNDSQNIYTVPSGKKAKITIESMKTMVELVSSDNGSDYRFLMGLSVDALRSYFYYKASSINQNLNGRSFETSELKAGCDFWKTEGYFIKPKRDSMFIKGATDFVEFTRSPQSGGNDHTATDRFARVYYLSSSQNMLFVVGKENTPLTMTTERLIVDISAQVVLEDL